MDDHGQRAVEEELGRAPPLGCREQDPLAGRAEREDAVEPGLGQEVEIRPEGFFVQGGSAVAERREGGGERSAQHLSNSTMHDRCRR